jgi:DNA polymerase III alpha subunit
MGMIMFLQSVAIGRMDTKAAIRDVSRALAIPLDQADKVAK